MSNPIAPVQYEIYCDAIRLGVGDYVGDGRGLLPTGLVTALAFNEDESVVTVTIREDDDAEADHEVPARFEVGFH